MFCFRPSAGWLGALSTAIALGISPISVALCKRKSTRVTAVIGGLVTALGCLFTSFASQFHQLFFSYGELDGWTMVLFSYVRILAFTLYFNIVNPVVTDETTKHYSVYLNIKSQNFWKYPAVYPVFSIMFDLFKLYSREINLFWAIWDQI